MKQRKNKSLFPPSIFFVYLIVLLVMAGIHTGLLALMGELGWNDTVQVILPVAYWSMIAASLTIFTRFRIQKTYDVPVQRLAEAARQVAEGDFSIYVSTMHTAENKDYLDHLIDDFNKMVAELGSMETLKTDFFANVSHEFKTPLAGIQNNAMLLRQKNLTEEKRLEYATAIIQSTQRLSNLISNMLKLNKLEKQTIVPHAEPYDICGQLCQCIIQFDGLLEKKNIEFEADLEDEAFIAADEHLLELVWNNLLSNAVKFTPSGGSIVLRQRTGADGIEVSVSDTGCGMDKETQKRIFEKFYQGDTSHSTEGNGLGLALTLRILHLLDCRITVQSEPDKKAFQKKRRFFYFVSVGKDGIMLLVKLGMSLISTSFFMFANALFSCGIGLARYTALKMQGKDSDEQLRLYRRVMAILSFSGLCYVGYSVRLFFGGSAGQYGMVMALAIAVYTFVEFGIQPSPVPVSLLLRSRLVKYLSPICPISAGAIPFP